MYDKEPHKGFSPLSEPDEQETNAKRRGFKYLKILDGKYAAKLKDHYVFCTQIDYPRYKPTKNVAKTLAVAYY